MLSILHFLSRSTIHPYTLITPPTNNHTRTQLSPFFNSLIGRLENNEQKSEITIVHPHRHPSRHRRRISPPSTPSGSQHRHHCRSARTVSPPFNPFLLFIFWIISFFFLCIKYYWIKFVWCLGFGGIRKVEVNILIFGCLCFDVICDGIIILFWLLCWQFKEIVDIRFTMFSLI